MRRITLRGVLEGREGRAWGWLLRGMLFPFACVFGGWGWMRAALFRGGWLRRRMAGVPVISVGNLTAGGTGKTPFVAWLVDSLCKRGMRPAILMRGYGKKHGGASDEEAFYHKWCPGVAVYAHPDRCRTVVQAQGEGADIVVLDDGFQHMRLCRDVDVVLLDATCPFGGGMPHPAGMLREWPGALGRADICVLTRTDQVEPGRVEGLRKRLQARWPGLVMVEGEHAPVRVWDMGGGEHACGDLKGREVGVLCGIGRPDAFERTVRDLGAAVAAAVSYPDHHAYTAVDVAGVLEKGDGTRVWVTTEKDAVKLAGLVPEAAAGRVWVLGVEMRLRAEADFWTHVDAKLHLNDKGI